MISLEFINCGTSAAAHRISLAGCDFSFDPDTGTYTYLQIDSNMIQINPKWVKIYQINSKWVKFIEIESNWFKLVLNDTKWFKMIQFVS